MGTKLGGGDVQCGQSIKLDFVLKSNKKLVAKQDDINSRYVVATLYNNGQAVEILDTAIATLNITRCDGDKKCYRAIVEDNKVKVFLSDWALELEGELKCDVAIREEQTILTTMTFGVKVERACCTSGDIEDAAGEDIITELIEDVVTNTADIAKNSSDIALLEAIVDKLDNPITSQIITITRDDWEYNENINKYVCTIEKNSVTESTYIIANEYEGVLCDAEIESHNGSYTITAPVKSSGAVTLLLIFLSLRGNEE